MEFMELTKKSRSYRGFDESRIITRVELEYFVDCARFAPSSANIQPLKYYLSYKKQEVEELLTLTKWGGALPELELPYKSTHPTAFVVICQDLEIAASDTLFLKDVGIVAQTMALSAADCGLSTCMIGNYNKEEIKELLNFKSHLEPVLIVAFGLGNETIIITEVEKNESTRYYRDENGVHYVPKRKLKDILI